MISNFQYYQDNFNVSFKYFSEFLRDGDRFKAALYLGEMSAFTLCMGRVNSDRSMKYYRAYYRCYKLFFRS